ncbi:hypothetical protein ACOMHN_016698 [Nucella lapillus]
MELTTPELSSGGKPSSRSSHFMLLSSPVCLSLGCRLSKWPNTSLRLILVFGREVVLDNAGENDALTLHWASLVRPAAI